MIGKLDIVTLQQIWWIICSVVGSLFLFLTFTHTRTHIMRAHTRAVRRRILDGLWSYFQA